MKLHLLFFASLILSIPSFSQVPSFLNTTSWSACWNEEEDDVPVDPGYWDQYYRMKKDKDGKIPRLPYAAIQEHELNAVNRDQQLLNVQELGPKNFGGRTRAILLDEDNRDHVFAGGISGGIWFSPDSGKTWTAVTDFLSSLAVSSLAQDFFNHDILYAGTGEIAGNSAGIPGNGVYRSIDHGLTFQALPSTDASAFDYIPRIVSSPVDSGGLFIATGNGGLYYSGSAGDTLKKVFITGAAINDLEITASGGVWIGVNSVGIFYSANGDSGTFQLVTSGLASAGSFARIEIAQAPSDPNILYAAFEKSGAVYYSGIKGIYKSTDGGLNWVEVGNPDVEFGFYMSFPWYSMSMAVKPDDPEFIVFGVGDLVYSVDGGIVWKVCNYIHPDHHVMVFNPDDPIRLYEGNDGGIHRFRTDKIWYTHTDLNNDYNTLQYYAGSFFPTGTSAVAGAQDNGSHYCLNGGADFNAVFGGDGSYNAINQQDPSIGYVSYQNGTIQRADDADYEFPTFYPIYGALDSDGDGVIDDGTWFINPFEINLVNGDELLFVTLQKIWQSLDGGFTWQPITNTIVGGISPYAVGMSKDFSPTIYIGGEYAIFYRIDDAYNAFPGDEVNLSASVPSSITGDFISNIAVHPTDKSICYVSLSSNSLQPRLWKVNNATSDSPVWTSISGDLPAGLPVNYIDIDPANPNNFLLAGTDYGLYTTKDGGAHWVKDNIIPNVVVQQVKVRASDRRVFVFTHGRGMWTGVLDPNVGIHAPSQNDITISLYPNPFQTTLVIKSTANQLTTTISDVNGRIVYNDISSAANQTLDLSNLSNGMYFIELKNKDGSVFRKIMKE